MTITIIGWYGTETIGDRAILTGLFSLFSKSYEKFEIKLGSLYPFFTERTINEDYSFYQKIVNKDFTIDIFNSKDSNALLGAIKKSDLVVMGGGPLMDLNELYMVEYAFKKARRLGVKTALLGCGVGPLFHKKYRKSVLNIVSNSDIVILRDSKSKENLESIYQEFNHVFNKTLVDTSFDPAVECVLEYNKLTVKTKKDYIAVNLREYPIEYGNESASREINEGLKIFIKDLAIKYPDKEIRLIPMHYFHVGGDDRAFLNTIVLELGLDNLVVQNANLTLIETIEVFQNAYFNIGMRFHSVVLQAISSGKNYILDYTEPQKGKISGFVSDIDQDGFFINRYRSLQKDKIMIDIIQNEDDIFHFDEIKVISTLQVYVNKLSEIKQ